MLNNLSHLLFAAFTYYLFGAFGLTLAIPPGFASAVWPASGIALACMLRLNRPMAAMGIGVGSFLLNLGVASAGFLNITLAAIIPAASIAIGAITQAAFGRFLFNRLLSKNTQLDLPKDILRFMLIVAPVGCLVAAFIGVSSLFLNAVIPLENVAFSWLTWWVGDTIGVLLFTPIFLVLLTRNPQLTLARKLQVIIPAMLIYLGVLVIFYASASAHHHRLSAKIAENAQHFYHVVSERFKISENVLRSFAAFFRSSMHVDREQFDSFSNIVLQGDTAFQAIGWTQVISAAERENYESQMRAQGITNFSFTELTDSGEITVAPQREEYHPVVYIYPLEPNRKALGLNLAADPVRYQALLQASLQAKPIATEPIVLAQETNNQKGLIIYYPVFRTSVLSPADAKASNKRVHGFISGVIRMQGILNEIIEESEQQGLVFSLIDISDPLHPKALVAPTLNQSQTFDPVSKYFNFGGRTLEFSFYPAAHFQALNKDWDSWIILTVGFLIAATLQALILMITGTTENIRQEVNRKTTALQLAKKDAEDASRAKSNFTANISHEIRTPLNAIVGLVNMTLKTGLNDTQQDYLLKAKLAASTLTDLINSTLDFSKIEAGRLEIDVTRFDFRELLSKIQAIFSTQAIERKLSFELVYPESCPRFLTGDPLRIEQILLNLCSNAFKFTHKGQVKLVVGTKQIAPELLQLKFLIQDTGIGFTAEQQQHLFQSFRQVDTSTSRKYGGTGLGLAISKQIIDMMGGTIDTSSVVGKGSEFIVRIPLAIPGNNQLLTQEEFHLPYRTGHPEHFDSRENHPATQITSLERAPSIASSPHELAYISILLVEDVELNQLIAQAMLEEHGARVTIANDGAEALKLLNKQAEFDLILMDIQMPKMDGYEATRLIRQDEKCCAIPILAMTANVMLADIEKCREVGMNDHIAKPLEETELLQKILNHLPLGNHA